MKRHHLNKFFLITLLILLVFSPFLTGCNPRNLPNFRQISEQEDLKSRKAAEEKISTSPIFRELHQLCTQEIPIFEDFSLITFNASWKKSDFLSYFYFSESDWGEVKSFYKDYFAKKGWTLVDEYDSGWGPNRIAVKRNSYRIILYNKGLGEEANYALHCEKLPSSEKPE